jgi:hypothetical protein
VPASKSLASARKLILPRRARSCYLVGNVLYPGGVLVGEAVRLGSYHGDGSGNVAIG